jgi:hypothetical protein
MGRVNRNRQRLATRTSGVWEAQSIEVAYEELTRSAFNVWIRMHVMTPNQMAMGRAKIAKVFGYSPDRSNVIMRELFHKGYIVPEARGFFKSTTFHLTKRASIRGSAYFVLTSLKKSTRK